MEVATGAMSTLLPKLGDLLKEEYKLQKSLRDDIKSLKDELESMHTALHTVSVSPMDEPRDRQVKLWARDVRELSYDIEDTIDTFMVRIDSCAPKKVHSLKGFIDRCLNMLTKAKTRRKLGTDIKDIKSRINEVRERRDKYKVDNVVAKPIGSSSIDRLRQSALHKNVTELVGIDEASHDLVKRLMDEESNKQLKIVSIVGFGGLGKTSLAKAEYEKDKVEFDYRAFVSISLNPNMKKILKNMLGQLDKARPNTTHEATLTKAQLIDELRGFLRDKRYFIVIDDIWDMSVWESIKHALIGNEHGSRIITTTRDLDVAKQIGGVYQLRPRSPVDSRKLFYQRIFGSEDKCPNQLAEVSKNILKKCGGVPLAIITIASMLASKKGKGNTQKYWSMVYQSIGSGLEDCLHVNNMRRILSVSYYDLPPHLKTCLLYLSLYPEDYEINAEYLIWKWVGEGFVHEDQGKTMYEVGRDYLGELINKSLVEPGELDGDGNAIHCYVHDMVLDLITFLSKEENFLTKLGGQTPISLPSKFRRLSLTEDYANQLATMSLSHVRSLIVFNKDAMLPALSSFQVLRVLCLSGCEQVNNNHCKDICNLFHLRYLGLSVTSITEIPKEIGNLKFLQVLDISWNNIKELPSTFVQLRQLVYLRIAHWTRLPDGFGNLESLQIFPVIITIKSPTMLHDLGRLTEMRGLKIDFEKWDMCYEEPFLQCLSNLVNLETLEMSYCHGLDSQQEMLEPGPQQLQSFMMANSTICAVPCWLSSLSSLTSLRIRLESLGDEDLEVLRNIPSLSDLDMWVEESILDRHKRLVIDYGYFCCLTRFKYTSETMELVFAEGAMEKLQILKLEFDVRPTKDRFGDFDFGLENISSLELLAVNFKRFYCYNKPGEVEAAKDAILKALNMNPNHPRLHCDDDDDEEDGEAEEEKEEDEAEEEEEDAILKALNMNPNHPTLDGDDDDDEEWEDASEKWDDASITPCTNLSL